MCYSNHGVMLYVSIIPSTTWYLTESSPVFSIDATIFHFDSCYTYDYIL